MEKLKLDLKNCYGIKSLQYEFDFAEQNVYAIYAANDSMKSSLAETFKDLSEEIESRDSVYPNRLTTRIISLIAFIFISNPCICQEKVPETGDSIPNRFFGQVSIGASIPTGNFPNATYGLHADINAKYFFIPRIAFIAKGGCDVNGLGTSFNPFIKNTFPYSFYFYQQYLGGVCFRSSLKNAHKIAHKMTPAPWFDLVALCGLSIAGSLPPQDIYAYNSSGIIANGESNSGGGYGFAYYIGGEFIVITKRKKIISLGAGYLGSTIRYANYTYNLTGLSNTPYAGLTTSIKSPQTYLLGEIQPYIGFGF